MRAAQPLLTLEALAYPNRNHRLENLFGFAFDSLLFLVAKIIRVVDWSMWRVAVELQLLPVAGFAGLVVTAGDVVARELAARQIAAALELIFLLVTLVLSSGINTSTLGTRSVQLCLVDRTRKDS